MPVSSVVLKEKKVNMLQLHIFESAFVNFGRLKFDSMNLKKN